MALFTTADRDAVKTAMVTAMTDGIASCTISGQTVTGRSYDELAKMLDRILADLARSNVNSGGGISARQIVPPGCG